MYNRWLYIMISIVIHTQPAFRHAVMCYNAMFLVVLSCYLLSMLYSSKTERERSAEATGLAEQHLLRSSRLSLCLQSQRRYHCCIWLCTYSGSTQSLVGGRSWQPSLCRRCQRVQPHRLLWCVVMVLARTSGINVCGISQ